MSVPTTPLQLQSLTSLPATNCRSPGEYAVVPADEWEQKPTKEAQEKLRMARLYKYVCEQNDDLKRSVAQLGEAIDEAERDKKYRRLIRERNRRRDKKVVVRAMVALCSL